MSHDLEQKGPTETPARPRATCSSRWSVFNVFLVFTYDDTAVACCDSICIGTTNDALQTRSSVVGSSYLFDIDWVPAYGSGFGPVERVKPRHVVVAKLEAEESCI